jgi:ferric-dicitrate binding protein FerR (iron transport regulator)
MDQNNDFIKDWLEGKISSEELAARKKKNDPVVHDFEELITHTAKLKVPDNVTQDEAWQKLSGRLSEAPKQEARVVKMNRWIPLSIAASITFIVVAFLLSNKVTVSTTLAETKVQLLPDGSEVTLNAASEISFRRIAWTGARTVSLSGEAFFNVKKGSTFSVETEQGTVTVLGTEFNVNARPSGFEVLCFTGKVSVTSGEKNIVLTKGMQTTRGPIGLADATSFESNRPTWRTGDFYFDEKPLSMVIEELERQFGLDIEFSGDGTRLYSGYFSNKNPDEALEMVFKPMALHYTRQPDHKIIVQ